MRKILPIITALVLFSVIQSYGQSFSKSEWDVISKRILDQNAENKMLRSNAKSDSATIAYLLVAHYDKDSTINKLAEKNVNLLIKLSNDTKIIRKQIDNIKDCEAEVKKQKTLKWGGIGMAALLTYLMTKSWD